MSEGDKSYLQRLRRAAKKTKLLVAWVPPGKSRREKSVTVCDGETQTTPTIEKSFSYDRIMIGNVPRMQVESHVVESFRGSLDSSEFCESSSVHDDVQGTSIPASSNSDSPYSAQTPMLSQRCSSTNSLMIKLNDIQQEINLIHLTLSSLKSGEKEEVPPLDHVSSEPPPPPPPPPPFPHPPLARLPEKPIVTLEDLLKVKLRQVPIKANEEGQPIISSIM